ncbi:ABC transporter substrate-binding protein [Undibacterium sp. RTI2.1]|uniref:ABC transporter substrate-binding protein n=1 Tax=unclassified Undibacterium TaxID=2630295 RepID=UPI002AB3B6E0|nr:MULTISPECIES: ABC transporter substrate-binding protein [unclassified Undibacterium]MDY7536860.1 ABC transporter substrate-binding protein [Undibacterium sp. 5I1]MEB0029475.1 ABC transporter substrate-binding protein [Undibacterium sp. RTI2.1]MEB0115661.1 ABC transporter substrate-binding protein [Undibacterium sp. RTI2.2]MEB0230365.1 ABC transporter substrate-binding protein [Undibacterium sp. 10I3]MEB0256742.1 ABC transporter substrate-binding protein [Undibacterium sp. 5I1]
MKTKNLLLGTLSLLFCIHSYAETGVTSKAILVGQSAALSGPAQQLGTEMRDGALAYFDHVNAQGGVAGRQIVLKTLDDGYEADRASANTKELIDKHDVFSLFGYVGTPTSNAALPLVAKEGIPFFAPFTGAESLREPFNRNVFNIRASYFEETEKIVQHITTLSMSRIAVFYQNDAYGKAGLEGVTKALNKRHIEVIGIATVERNSVDVAPAVAKIKQAKPQAVIMISAYKSCAAFIKEMVKDPVGAPIFWNISFVGSQALSKELGSEGRGVMISQVVPAPWEEINPLIKEYKTLYANKPGREPGYVSLEGFIAAKVFVEGLKRAGSSLTRDSFIKAMESMGAYDAGGFSVKFSPTNHNASHFVELTVIGKDGKFMK